MQSKYNTYHNALAIITASKLNLRVRFVEYAKAVLDGKELDCCEIEFNRESDYCRGNIWLPYLRSQASIIYVTLNKRKNENI